MLLELTGAELWMTLLRIFDLVIITCRPVRCAAVADVRGAGVGPLTCMVRVRGHAI